jgi:four helix bundle protein
MKRKTPNAQRRTSNAEVKKTRTKSAEWSTANTECSLHEFRVNDLADSEYGARRDRRYDLEDRLLEFAVDLVELTELLPNTRAGNRIAGQLLRCGTSPLSNHGEVEAAESRKDFLHKLRICLKELRETKRWLRLVSRLEKLGEPANLRGCLNEVEEPIRIFAASVKTAEKNAKL